MAGNPTPDDPDDLLALAEDVADGLQTLEVAVGVKQNTEAVIRAAIAAYRAADVQLGAAKSAEGVAASAVNTADGNARIFLLAARKVLALSLGETWSAAWEATGFPNQSTAVPRSQEERMNLCASLKAYFAANPGKESAQFGVTAAGADAKFTALSDARDDLDAKDSDVAAKTGALNTAFKNLRKRVRGLVTELDTLLEDDDPRWHEFGLSMPGDPDTPEKVGGLTLTPSVPGSMIASWLRAPRASRYRVFKQVLTVDSAPVNVTTVHDLQTIIDALPRGKTLRVTIVAANEAGEAPSSDAAEIVIP